MTIRTITSIIFGTVILTGTGTWLFAAPGIGAVSATPNIIPANTSMSVTVVAEITDPLLIPASVNLLQINNSGASAVILGQLHDDGKNGDAVAGDHLYTIVQTFTAPIGQSQLQVSAAFRGLLKRVLSSPVMITSLATPTAFTVDPGPLATGGPLSFNTFGNEYIQGGVIPQNGAAIDITSVPLPPPPLSDFIAKELQGSLVKSTGTLVVGGSSCTQLFYSDSFGPSLVYENETLYCPAGTRLYKFYLTYNAGDSNANTYLASFQQIVNSAVLTP